MVEVVEKVFIPGIGAGSLSRTKLRQYLADRFPSSRNVKDCAQAIANAMTAAGVARADRVELSFGYREIPMASFAFVVHSEFPEPGMYDLANAEENQFIRAMLWGPDRILPAFYELRNRGLISKVSEIDSVRQFTTKWSLAEVVKRLAEEEAERERHGDH